MSLPMIDIDYFSLGFGFVQLAYLGALLVVLFLFTRPTNFVDMAQGYGIRTRDLPYIVLFYPVLRELESTMRTTFLSLDRLDYPKSRFRVIAIPNADDKETLASLQRLKQEFSFLQILAVPPTSHKSWQPVWESWNATRNAYWWHKGSRARNKALPPKKTRQLIYAFYNIAERLKGYPDFLVNYIDADSCPPADHFRAAAAGMKHYDVLQAQNIAGNLNSTLAASWHAFDHMVWDGHIYPHLSANGKQPFWVLGKGLFFKASDLIELGGFNPWITIEDPEVGMRFWTHGKRLGIIENPLVEEVPSTFAHGITQRKRWIAGFFQSLAAPLREMGMTPRQRFLARLNFVPCLSLWLNSVGWPMGLVVTWQYFAGNKMVSEPLLLLGLVNGTLFLALLGGAYARTWRRSALVLKSRWQRVVYLLRINPLFVLAWWIVWLVPLFIGLRMFLLDQGLVWERTEKIDANHKLVRATLLQRPAPLPEPMAAMPLPISNSVLEPKVYSNA
jgi:cellulose synthase/poly-beta-1,6-N-acetylglucosamine synthase-like glycosyltransferase